MHGLYVPLNEAVFHPSALVKPTELMRKQISAWLARLGTSGGVSLLNVMNGAKRRIAGLTVVASSDAANDETAAGLGGFCHGFHWYLALPKEAASAMHITLLEFLATAFSFIVFHRHVRRFARVVFLSDAISTPYALSRESEKSPVLRLAHFLLRQTKAHKELAALVEVAHLGGDRNALADAVSRNHQGLLQALARQLRIRLTSLPLPDEASRIFYECWRFCNEQQRSRLLRSPRRREECEITLPAQPADLSNPWRDLVILASSDDACGPNYVYCGRGGSKEGFGAAQGHAYWGNYAWTRRVRNETDRAASISAYRQRVLTDPAYVAKARRELKGRRLGCFCVPKDCHCHVLAEVANCSAGHLARYMLMHALDVRRPEPTRGEREREKWVKRIKFPGNH